MRVKFLRGDNQQYTLYNVVMPEDTEIEDLPTHIQDSINVLGELGTFDTKDLSNENDEWSLKMKEQIQEMGACLMKFNLVHSNSRIPTWPKGINYTFPPFSELNEAQLN